MLLVDDDQTQVGKRREHRRPRPDADARAAVAQATPLVVALTEAELRVQDRDTLAEALLEAARGLRSERDLRDHDDRGAPLRERLVGRAQVHLGLAAARHAVQEQRSVAALAQRFEHRAQRRPPGPA